MTVDAETLNPATASPVRVALAPLLAPSLRRCTVAAGISRTD